MQYVVRVLRYQFGACIPCFMTTSDFTFCSSPQRAMITASIVDGDPGTHFLCLEAGDDIIELSLDQVPALLDMITATVAGVNR
ncbi:hypothetical protein [Williamsia herbipolensis]|uniref:hypothetical protein n=1 Tax=Williamsia herbipolensis TaxID=1603258 RepID=UPI000A4B5553|nr:hypothetical protein [Williamsia herbipolensis]